MSKLNKTSGKLDLHWISIIFLLCRYFFLLMFFVILLKNLPRMGVKFSHFGETLLSWVEKEMSNRNNVWHYSLNTKMNQTLK